jgi:predicted nucleic acid-binding protein
VSSGHTSTGPIVVDTTVFGARLIKVRAGLARQHQPLIAGREAHISFVTEAELRFGARWAGWGEARLHRLEAVLASADAALPGPELIKASVSLRHQCMSTGHGLAQKEHEADRWVAATALWMGLPLGAHDGSFRDVPGLQLLTTLG